jgi:hypothetical protein
MSDVAHVASANIIAAIPDSVTRTVLPCWGWVRVQCQTASPRARAIVALRKSAGQRRKPYSEATRAHLLAMAEVWDRLAEQHNESTTEVSERSAPETEHPSVQQQQVQPDDDEKG